MSLALCGAEPVVDGFEIGIGEAVADAEVVANDPFPASRPASPSLDEPALRALLVRIVEREESAFEAFYDATTGRVHALVRRFVFDAALAEEVVEDVFFQVWRQAPRFDADRGRVVAWLLSMARSRAIDALRRDDRRDAECQLSDEVMETVPCGQLAPLDLLSAARRDSRLHSALTELDPLPRQLLSLAFFRGLTHEEVAAETGMPLGTVKSTIRRALIALRAALGSEMAPGPLL